MEIKITHIDTACVLLEINGYKILTDPTLDRHGKYYYHGYGTFSKKLDDPVLTESLDDVDLVLLSHHQHHDNFDVKGKEFVKSMDRVISTKSASKQMDGIIGLDDWESVLIDTPKLVNLKITATPAQHHPWWVPGFLAGKVIGFIIEYDGQQNGAIYISGDTVFFDGIAEVATKFKVDIGIFHLGAVQFRYLTGFGQYTMDGKGFIKAISLLKPRIAIPVHFKGWSHFQEREDKLRTLINLNHKAKKCTLFLIPGAKTTL